MVRFQEMSLNGHNQKCKANSSDGVAIIGMAIKLPHSDTADSFWQSIQAGLDFTGGLSEKRREELEEYQELLNNQAKYLNVSYLEDINDFDYNFFKLSPMEAKLLSPIHRQFLQTAVHAIEDAGYGGNSLNGARAGVYVGAIGDYEITKYKKMIKQINPNWYPTAQILNLCSMVGARLSRLYKWKGPCITCDTACSSALVALDAACQAIRNNTIDYAVVGSSRIIIHPFEDESEHLGIESSDGYTYSFDDSADGSGFGEGVIVFLLKSLTKAVNENDHIWAVLKGSAVNYGSASMGITAPNPEAQSQVIMEAWKDAGIRPESLAFIEAHGTGTELGDPIEVEGLNHAFSHFTAKKQFCAVSSVKSNVGHLFECSGLVGVVKCIQALHHKTIPSGIHFTKPNRHTEFVQSPLYVSVKSRPWNGKEPMRCGISSFGLSGTNCHVVLEAPPVKNTPINLDNLSHIFSLSASGKEELEQSVNAFSRYLQENTELSLASVCKTLATGRTHFSYRISILADSMPELVEKLKYVQKQGAAVKGNGCFYGEKAGAIALSSVCHRIDHIQSGNILISLAEDYAQGADIPWEIIYPDHYVTKISLPGSEFKKLSCWPIDNKSKMEAKGMRAINLSGMFHQLHWKEQKMQEEIKRESWPVLFVMGARSKLGTALAGNLLKGEAIIAAVGEKEEITEEESGYVVDGSEKQFITLLHELNSTNVQIVYCADLIRKAECKEELDKNVRQNLLVPLNLVKALEKTNKVVDLRFIVKAANEVTGFETEIIPESGILFGFANALSVECENIMCSCIDMDRETGADIVCRELKTPSDKKAVAFRKGIKYICELQEISGTSEIQDNFVKEDGVYLITGGTGELGLAAAGFLAKQKSLHIILLSRKTIPEHADWKRIAEKKLNENYKLITALIELESNTKSLEVVSADIGDMESVSLILNQIHKKYHRINGVIHAAGAAYMQPVRDMNPEQLHQMIVPKIYGTFVLEECLKNETLDFFLLYSSVACVFPSLGQACYAAANAYMDSFSDYRNRQSQSQTLSIQWATWREIGMAARQNINIDTITKTLSTKEALEALKYASQTYRGRILSGKLNYGSGLMALLRQYYFSLSQQLEEKVKSSFKKMEESKEFEFDSGKEASNSQVQESLIEVFKQCLGYSEIEIWQNIFELGAESLTIKKMYEKLKALYGEAIVQTDFFEYPTAAKLADKIIRAMGGHNDKEKEEIPKDTLEELLDKLQSGSIDPEQALRIIGIQ